MRICRLDLLRYGRFTNVSLELPNCDPDIHIIFGPNEAGKSTALSALEDFLFGIPRNSSLNFLHDYGSMQIGALLEKDGETLEARRRKGNRDTLLTPSEVPIPTGDRALTSFLAGADRSFFERMFSLDHERLRKGGREILEAQDEVGQMLFSAGTGISGLNDRLRALEAEADALWAPRRAAHRKFYQGEDRLKAAEKELREQTVTASTWQDLRRAYDAAQESYAALDKEIEGKSAELRKLNRIRRVYRDVGRKSDLESKIVALGKVTPLVEDARGDLETAEREDARAAARMQALKEPLETALKELEVLTCDEELLLREEDIKQLHEQRIQVRAGKADLPKRRAELADAEAALQRLASELEWKTADINQLVSRIPARPPVATVRALLNKRGEVLIAAENAKIALDEAETRVAELTQQLDKLGVPVDVSNLVTVIEVTRESGDIAARIAAAEGEEREAQASVQENLTSLRPKVTNEQTLTVMNVPPRDTVQTHRDTLRELDQSLRVCRENIRRAEQDMEWQKKAHERVTGEEHAVSPEELARLRKHRDLGWSLIRRRYVEGESIQKKELYSFIESEGDLPDAYESSVHSADEGADRRFDKAEAAAQLAVISRQIAEQEETLEGLRREDKALEAEGHELDTAWEAMWGDVPFTPLSPDVMLEWITARAEVLNFAKQRDQAKRESDALRLQEKEAKEQLLKEIKKVNGDSKSLKDQTLRIIVEAAANVQRRHEQNNENIQQTEKELRNAKADTDRKRKALDEAERVWAEWKTHWAGALSTLGLVAGVNHEAVAVQVDVIDEMREIAVRANELRNERISKIEQYITSFGDVVAEVVSAVAPDISEEEPEDAVLTLELRLDEARRIRELRKQKGEDIASFEENIKECEESWREAREIIHLLQETAGVENVDQLKTAIDKSDSLRNLQGELSHVIKTLNEESDGFPVEELQAECEFVDLDQIAVREELLNEELKEMRERLMKAQEVRSEARQAFEAIGGDDAAAQAAANRQAALAEMGEVTEQYVRVRSAALLLQWAIDRYRREKQAPLLTRAGQLFSTLTSGSFSSLLLEFDEQDNANLAGLRPDGEKVSVKGMSSGTDDQLYLALRMASVEDYLERASALPFVADDLFINFDDARAAAGFEVMGQLAKKTQVLFFTHHQHLVDVARKTLGSSVSVITLLQGEHM